MNTMRNAVSLGLAITVLAACGQAPETDAEAALDGANSAFPSFTRVAGWGALPDNLVFGTVSGISVDAQDNVWVLHRPRTVAAEGAQRAAPPVVVLDADGNMLDAWGGSTTAYEWPQNEHGIHVDDAGFVWISGNYCTNWINEGRRPANDDQVLKLTADGELVIQIGGANESMGNDDTRNFHRPAAMQVYAPTNEVFVADGYGNHRIIVMDADTGAYKRMWGAFGNAPQDDHRCGTGFFGPDAPAWDADQFSTVHGLAVSDDGIVYVADREHGRLQLFSVAGEYLDQIDTGSGGNIMTAAFSADAEQEYLYLWGADQIQIYDRQSLELLTTIADAPDAGGPGHMMSVDSQGNLYLARLAGGVEKYALR